MMQKEAAEIDLPFYSLLALVKQVCSILLSRQLSLYVLIRTLTHKKWNGAFALLGGTCIWHGFSLVKLNQRCRPVYHYILCDTCDVSTPQVNV